MTSISISAEVAYDVDTPSSFAFAFTAARTSHQVVVSEVIDVRPDVETSLVPYGEGTHQLLRLEAMPGGLEVRYRAEVSLDGDGADPARLEESTFAQVPADVMPYLNPSRYCESDMLGSFAARHFGETTPGHPRVREITEWVRSNILYEAGSTDGSSSATDVLLQRAGVCRDFAHVSIALCRALGIPARYVSGYGVGVEPQDFHGFFEAFLGGDWYLFDPTGMAAVDQLVRIGFGRDAADAPFATFVGDATLRSKTIAVELLDAPPVHSETASTA